MNFAFKYLFAPSLVTTDNIELDERLRFFAGHERRNVLLHLVAIILFILLVEKPAEMKWFWKAFILVFFITSIVGAGLVRRLLRSQPKTLGRQDLVPVLIYSLFLAVSINILNAFAILQNEFFSPSFLAAILIFMSTSELTIFVYGVFHRWALCLLAISFLNHGALMASSDHPQAKTLFVVLALYFFAQTARLYQIRNMYLQFFGSKLRALQGESNLEQLINCSGLKLAWVREDLSIRLLSESGKLDPAFLAILNPNSSIGAENEIIRSIRDGAKSPNGPLFLGANLRFEFATPDGRLHLWNVSPIRTENRTEFIVSAQDVEDQFRTRQALELERAKAIETAHLAALGEMAAGIAHEIRNPLMVIKSNLFLLRRTLEPLSQEVNSAIPVPRLDFGEVDRLISPIEATVKKVGQIVDALRNLARRNLNPQLEEISVAEVLRDPLALAQEQLLKSKIALEVIMPQEDLRCRCDKSALGQVILNLIINAADALTGVENPTIRISAREVQGSVYRPDSPRSIEIEIADNGPGVADTTRIFHPFYTTKDPGKGTGLGLSISKKIMLSMGGDLIYSRDNLTRFTVIL